MKEKVGEMTAYVAKTKQNFEIRVFKTCFLVLFLGLSSCSKMAEINGFDATLWKMDFDGCKGDREKLSAALENGRKNLRGIGEHEVLELFGKPNSVQLLERQQRYFIYWIQNPSSCQGKALTYKEMKIRLSALNTVTEVLF